VNEKKWSRSINAFLSTGMIRILVKHAAVTEAPWVLLECNIIIFEFMNMSATLLTTIYKNKHLLMKK
jgi:hypothetical protein